MPLILKTDVKKKHSYINKPFNYEISKWEKSP